MIPGGVPPSITIMDIMMASDGVQLTKNFSEAQEQLVYNQVLYKTCFGHQNDIVTKLCIFFHLMVKQELMLERYMPQELTLRQHLPAIMTRWV